MIHNSNQMCISVCLIYSLYEIPQEITNENAITLVYYLAQQIPHVIDGLIKVFHLVNNVQWVKWLLP